MNKLVKLQRFVWRLEDATLALMLFSMILVAVVQIVLRNFFGTGLLWADAFVRVLVLWTALLGAMVAARSGRHINMDVITPLLPHAIKNIVRHINHLAVSIISSLACVFGVRFVMSEYESGLLSFLNIPLWMTQTVIPLAFGVIAWRYFGHVFSSAQEKRS